jgi:hypothetical protein
VKHAHVFKVPIHLNVVEDLCFYHYPREELVADGKVTWRDFSWRYGRPDGELDEDKDHFHPVTRHCGSDFHPRGHPRDDDEGDRGQKRQQVRAQGFLHRVTNWMDNRGMSKCRGLKC